MRVGIRPLLITPITAQFLRYLTHSHQLIMFTGRKYFTVQVTMCDGL